MTVKEYLSKIQTYRRAITSAQLRIEELERQASGLKAFAYDKERVQTSPENRLEDIMVKIDDQARKLARQILRYQSELQKREQQIITLDNPDHVEILRLRYLELNQDDRPMSLEEIACYMHLSFYRVAHLHGEALAAFNRKYKVSKH